MGNLFLFERSAKECLYIYIRKETSYEAFIEIAYKKGTGILFSICISKKELVLIANLMGIKHEIK